MYLPPLIMYVHLKFERLMQNKALENGELYVITIALPAHMSASDYIFIYILYSIPGVTVYFNPL